MQHVQQVAGAESECDPVGILLDEFQRVEADNFTAHIYQRTAAVAGIDRRIGLDPGTGTGFAEFSNRAHNSFGHAELHGATRVSDGENALTLAYGLRISERQMRKILARNFHQSNVQILIDINNVRLQLLAIGQRGKQRCFVACHMSIRRDYARFRNEKTAAHFLQALQLNHGWFRDRGQRFKREFRRKHFATSGDVRAHTARKRAEQQIKLCLEMVALEEPVRPVISAFQRNPLCRAFCQGDFLDGIALQAQPSGKWVRKP